jgi:hypothetical protein
MPAVQNQNLNDTFAQQYAAVASGLLARADFPADTVTVEEFCAICNQIALASTRRIARTVSDMSTVTPTVATFDTGYTLSAKLFTPPAEAPPPARFVPPKTVVTPSGKYVEEDKGPKTA